MIPVVFKLPVPHVYFFTLSLCLIVMILKGNILKHNNLLKL